MSKKSNECIGQIAFCKVYSDSQIAKIEYCIGETYWGNGYANEALDGVIHFTFENTDLKKLKAYHREVNMKSGKVLQKSSMHVTDNVQRFIQEGILPHGEICYCIER